MKWWNGFFFSFTETDLDTFFGLAVGSSVTVGADARSDCSASSYCFVVVAAAAAVIARPAFVDEIVAAAVALLVGRPFDVVVDSYLDSSCDFPFVAGNSLIVVVILKVSLPFEGYDSLERAAAGPYCFVALIAAVISYFNYDYFTLKTQN